MGVWVEKLFADYERRMAKEGKKEEALTYDNAYVHRRGRGEPPKSPSQVQALPLPLKLIIQIGIKKLLLKSHF